MKAKAILLLAAALLLFAAACSNASSAPEQQPQEQAEQETGRTAESNPAGLQNIGAGATVFLFEVTDDTGNVNSWNVHTDETTVGAALVDVGLIEGTESEFGLMVFYVNGIRADFDEDGAWWAFFIDGEMAMVGVDSTDIEEGVTYAFVYTEA